MNFDDNFTDKIKKLATLPHNKVCADCNAARSTLTNSTIGTFICSDCGNVLRTMNPPHFVQSLALTNYNKRDFKHFSIHGNEMCNKIWLNYFDPRHEYYSVKICGRMRARYLTDKYVEKRWLAKDKDFDLFKKEISLKMSSSGSDKSSIKSSFASLTNDFKKNYTSKEYQEFLATDQISSPALSINHSRCGSTQEFVEKINPNIGVGIDNKIFKNENSFDPFNENNVTAMKSITSVDGIFSNDPFYTPKNNIKSENNLCNVINEKGTNHFNNTVSHKPSLKMGFQSAAQFSLDNSVSCNPFSNKIQNRTNENNSTVFTENGSMGDAFGAASVTDWRANSTSSVYDKSAASTTISHYSHHNSNTNHAININGHSEALNPFDTIHEDPFHANGSMNVFPKDPNIAHSANENDLSIHNVHNIHNAHNAQNIHNSHNIHNIHNMHNMHNIHSSGFLPHMPTTQSVNMFSTVKPAPSNPDLSFFAPTAFSTQNNIPSSVYDSPFATTSQNQTLSNHKHLPDPFRNTQQPTSSPDFDNFFTSPQLNTQLNKITFASDITPFRNIITYNNTFGGSGQEFNSLPQKSNKSSNRQGSNYDELRNLKLDNNQGDTICYSAETSAFDDLDPFAELGFKKLPPKKPTDEKKLTLSQMASKSDSVNFNPKY